MQTDKFDDIFRKKIRNLYPVTSEDDVERIHSYISSKGKFAPDISWSKYLLYAATSVVLIGSLCYNYRQFESQNQLLLSIDSLKIRATAIDNKTIIKTLSHVDTIYINRKTKQIFLTDERNSAGIGQQVSGLQNGKHKFLLTADSDSLINNNGISFPELHSGNVNSEGAKNLHTYENRLTQRAGQKLTAHYNFGSENLLSNTTITNNIKALQADSSGQKNTVFNSSEIALQTIRPEGNTFPGNVPFPNVKVPQESQMALPKRQSIYSNWIRPRLDNLNLYAGAGFDAGSSQIGASLLAEIRVNSKWSVQTGARWLNVIGNQYFTAEQYSVRTGKDFRSLYAPYVPQNYDVLNIDENYQLLQIPVSVAYHYGLKHNWVLRFGVGTDLALLTKSQIDFDYKENNSNYEQGVYSSRLAVNLLNNISANAGVEKYWNKFIFRISPFATLQIRNVVYGKESWALGGRLQVLYRIR